MHKRPPAIDVVELAKKGEDVHTFSNGTEWYDWADDNCYACRWYDEDTAGAGCAFEAAAFLGAVTPYLARLFGWTQRTTEYGPRSGWDAPDPCAFLCRKDDENGEGGDPVPPIIDPLQLTFLAPEGWPEAPPAPVEVTVA